MKTLSLYLFIFLLSFHAYSQNDTLLTINNKPISEGEFLRIYQKNNNTGNVVDKKTVEEYLDLFINFKLKVAEAESRGMDTLPKFLKEFNGYKVQLEKPYFTDKKVDERLVKEAFDRQQFDVRASHILIMVAKDATPADTLAAYNKIKAIRKQIVEGKKDFVAVAKQKSEDPSAKQNGGDLGYFTVFQMVYPFENAAYNTKVGEVSDIVRTRYGYHILKVVDKRPAKGEVQVAHIMIAVPKEADSTKIKAAKVKIDMIYSKLQKGEKFKDLAQLYSDDKGSAKNGGQLQWFGTGRMVPEFENTAFGLKNKGDYSKPVRTNFGWHIIQLIDKKAPKKFDESEKTLRTRIDKDMRARTSKDAVINRLKKEYNYSPNTKRLADFYRVIDQSIFSGNWNKDQAKKLNKSLFSLNDSVYNQQAFVEYLAKNSSQKRNKGSVKDFINKFYNLFVENELKAVERVHLSEKYPEYRYLLQEYHDGILLFDLTDKEVWTKAIEDSVGLENFYEKNKNNYKWGQRVEAQVYSVKDAKVLAKLKKLLLKKNAKGYTKEFILQSLNKKDSTAAEFVKENIYSKGDYSIIDKADETLKFFENQDLKTPLIFDVDNKVVYVSKIIPIENKQLNEAKGQITADYQDYLEKQWIEVLRKKYTVSVNKAVWSKIKE